MRRLIVFLKNLMNIPYRILFTHISVLAGIQESMIDKHAAICSGVRFYRSDIKKYSYVGKNTFITNTHIGAFTSISGDCYIGGTSHPLEWVSTSSVFHKWDNIVHKNFAHFEYEIFHDTTIGSDVWIGQGCMIKSGVTIADGAVIGMGSVVTKDIGPYEIWAGNPAKLIRKRFTDEDIKQFISLQWWNWPEKKLEQYAELFNSPDMFLQQCKKNGDFNQ